MKMSNNVAYVLHHITSHHMISNNGFALFAFNFPFPFELVCLKENLFSSNSLVESCALLSKINTFMTIYFIFLLYGLNNDEIGFDCFVIKCRQKIS